MKFISVMLLILLLLCHYVHAVMSAYILQLNTDLHFLLLTDDVFRDSAAYFSTNKSGLIGCQLV